MSRHPIHQQLHQERIRIIVRIYTLDVVNPASSSTDHLLGGKHIHDIAAKTIVLPHHQIRGLDLRDLTHHPLETGTVRVRTGPGRIIVLSKDSQLLRSRPPVYQLTLLIDGRLIL